MHTHTDSIFGFVVKLPRGSILFPQERQPSLFATDLIKVNQDRFLLNLGLKSLFPNPVVTQYY